VREEQILVKKKEKEEQIQQNKLKEEEVQLCKDSKRTEASD
jgi:hypothetical protein